MYKLSNLHIHVVKTFKKLGKIIKKNIYKHISVYNITESPVLPVLYHQWYVFSSSCLYENYLICIFVNINDDLKMKEKFMGKLVSKGVIRPTMNTLDSSLWVQICSTGPLKCKNYCHQK